MALSLSAFVEYRAARGTFAFPWVGAYIRAAGAFCSSAATPIVIRPLDRVHLECAPRRTARLRRFSPPQTRVLTLSRGDNAHARRA